MSRTRRRILLALFVVGSCHADPVGDGSGGCVPSFGGGCTGDYRGRDGGEAGPRDEPACWELCEDRGPGWAGRMVWTGSELVCDCDEIASVPCEPVECGESCASAGYEHGTCETVGCRCSHVPAVDAGDGDADGLWDVADAEVDPDGDAEDPDAWSDADVDPDDDAGEVPESEIGPDLDTAGGTAGPG